MAKKKKPAKKRTSAKSKPKKAARKRASVKRQPSGSKKGFSKSVDKYRHKGKIVRNEVKRVATLVCGKLQDEGIKCSYQYIIDKFYYFVDYFIKHQTLHKKELNKRDAIIASYLDFDNEHFYGSEIQKRMEQLNSEFGVKNFLIKRYGEDKIKSYPFANAMAVTDYELYLFWGARDAYLISDTETFRFAIYLVHETLTNTVYIDFNDYITNGGNEDEFAVYLNDQKKFRYED